MSRTILRAPGRPPFDGQIEGAARRPPLDGHLDAVRVKEPVSLHSPPPHGPASSGLPPTDLPAPGAPTPDYHSRTTIADPTLPADVNLLAADMQAEAAALIDCLPPA